MAGLSRRGFLLTATAAGGALGAAPAQAAPPARPSVRPGPAAPVRALHDGVPYWDFSGAAEPANAQKAKAQPALDDLPPEDRWRLGGF